MEDEQARQSRMMEEKAKAGGLKKKGPMVK